MIEEREEGWWWYIPLIVAAGAVIAMAYAWPSLAGAHGGTLDKIGCHWNLTTVVYECHKGTLTGKKWTPAQKIAALTPLTPPPPPPAINLHPVIVAPLSSWVLPADPAARAAIRIRAKADAAAVKASVVTDGQALGISSQRNADGEFEVAWPAELVRALGSGPHTIEVTVDDGLGHASTISVTFQVAVATGPAPAPVVSFSLGGLGIIPSTGSVVVVSYIVQCGNESGVYTRQTELLPAQLRPRIDLSLAPLEVPYTKLFTESGGTWYCIVSATALNGARSPASQEVSFVLGG